MTLRNYVLFGLGLYAAMAAGILGATSGRALLLAAVIPLAIVGPVWMFERRKWVNPQPVPGRAATPQKPVVVGIILLCLTVPSATLNYTQSEWVGFVLNCLMVVCTLVWTLDAAKRMRRKSKDSDAVAG